jgi:hypothetical protein
MHLARDVNVTVTRRVVTRVTAAAAAAAMKNTLTHSPLVADLLLNQSHRKEGSQVFSSNRLHCLGVQRGWRRAGQIGDDVVPEMRYETQREGYR